MSTILIYIYSIYAYTYTSSLGRVTHLIAPIGNSICRLQAPTISSTVHIQYNFYSTYPIYLSTDRILATSFVDYRLQLSPVHIQFNFYSTHPMYLSTDCCCWALATLFVDYRLQLSTVLVQCKYTV